MRESDFFDLVAAQEGLPACWFCLGAEDAIRYLAGQYANVSYAAGVPAKNVRRSQDDISSLISGMEDGTLTGLSFSHDGQCRPVRTPA